MAALLPFSICNAGVTTAHSGVLRKGIAPT